MNISKTIYLLFLPSVMYGASIDTGKPSIAGQWTHVHFQWTDLSDARLPVYSANGYYPSQNRCISGIFYSINSGPWSGSTWAATDSAFKDSPCPGNGNGAIRWLYQTNILSYVTNSALSFPYNLCVELRAQKGGENQHFFNERENLSLVASACSTVTGINVPACSVKFNPVEHGTVTVADVVGHTATSSGTITCPTSTAAEIAIRYNSGQGASGLNSLTSTGGGAINNRTTFSVGGAAYQSTFKTTLPSGTTTIDFKDTLQGGTISPGDYSGSVIVIFANH